ncbi:hypothetical protein HDU83_002707 [Entophlyctis luteolus]|nr:hypothetical protein HDU83_002707 [Entophlyctis luteolus]
MSKRPKPGTSATSVLLDIRVPGDATADAAADELSPPLSSLARALSSLLTSSRPDSQLKAIRDTAHALKVVRSGTPLTHQQLSFFQKTVRSILPGFCDAFFSKAEPSTRMALLAVLSRVADFENGVLRQEVIDIIKSGFTAFLKATSTACENRATVENDIIPTFCSICFSMVEWSYGHPILMESLELSFLTLCSLLSTVTGSMTVKDDALRTSQRVKSCTELLRTALSFFAKLGSGLNGQNMRSLLDGASAQEAMKALLDQSVQITFSDSEAFVRDCRFVSGIVLAWILELRSNELRDWVQVVFFGDQYMDSFKELVNLSKLVTVGSEDIGKFYPLLCFIHGVLSTVGGQAALVVDHTAKKSLLSTTYERVASTVPNITDPSTRIMTFQTLSVWMTSLRDALRMNYKIVGINVAVVFKELFDFVFTFWEDPVDATQHKLKDIFCVILEITSDLKEKGDLEFSTERSFVYEIVTNLLAVDWSRKVSFHIPFLHNQ